MVCIPTGVLGQKEYSGGTVLPYPQTTQPFSPCQDLPILWESAPVGSVQLLANPPPLDTPDTAVFIRQRAAISDQGPEGARPRVLP